MKRCSKCWTSKPLSEFWRNTRSWDGRDGWCKTCKNTATKKWRESHAKKQARSKKKWRRENRVLVLAEKTRYRQRHPEQARQQVRNAHKRHGKKYRSRRYFALIEERHGLTKKQIQAQSKKQKHRCIICHKKQKCGKRRRLYVDHDHKTGKFRGLACFSCNSMLGFAKDNIKTLQSAIRYLRSQK